MEQSNQSKRVLLSVIGVAILVVAVVGVSFAFFNYTRTGTTNSIGTGSIYFLSEQDGSIAISNFFPTATGATDVTNSSTMTVTITGGTTWAGGIDYTMTATNVTRASNVENVPVTVTVKNLDGNLSSGSHTFTGIEGTELDPAQEVSSNMTLATGHIAPTTNGGTTGRISGVVTITAFIPNNVAITDTYNNGNTPTNELGTTTEWVNNRRVITTSDWNSLASNPITFQVKVVADEGAAPVNS